MASMMEDKLPGEYEIFYIHQCDNRDFNRGAMKNIGFIMIRSKYPLDYKNITLVFNDIDIMPLTKNFFDYETQHNKIKHFYGFEFTLGGIVSIKGADFERINGFPNFWTWGYEDNLLQRRALLANINIDRSNFYPIYDKNILLLHDTVNRVVNKHEFDRYIQRTPEGINSIYNLRYDIDEKGFVNVRSFSTSTEPISKENTIHDLRNGPAPFKGMQLGVTGRRRGKMGMFM
jgi:hypothetical protein